MQRILCFRPLVLVLLFSSLLLPACLGQEAITAHRRSLAELIDESAYIIHGRVTAVRVEPHPNLKNLTTVLVTMDVQDALKGDVSRSFTFRQFVWDIRSTSGGYRKKEELLLFLRAPSRYGLTSPAGLSQGRFVIQPNALGVPVAVNADNNIGLFASLSKAAKARGATLPAAAVGLSSQGAGPVPLRDLKAVVRSLNVRSR